VRLVDIEGDMGWMFLLGRHKSINLNREYDLNWDNASVCWRRPTTILNPPKSCPRPTPLCPH
jgi:hypothetical protein